MDYSPRSIPLPRSPLPPLPSVPSSPYPLTRRSSGSTQSSFIGLPPPALSPRTLIRPGLSRNRTSITLRPDAPDPFKEGTTISVNQPVGSLSISPSSRDVCLASRKGLYILDLANLNNAPRFIPQGGTWQIADCQWSPHVSTSNLILSTSSQKLLLWDLSAQTSRVLMKSIDAHARAITDINWHARNPYLMATVAMDAGIRTWDMRMNDNRPLIRLCAWGQAGTQVKWNRQHDHLLATAHGKEAIIWDDRKGSVPICTIKAHDAKIYGIDWDRRYRHKLVTCSLDKTIKFWSIPELAQQATAINESHVDLYPNLPSPDQPTRTISTSYPIWRARHLPFGEGVLALPQRGEKDLELFGMQDEQPVERFEGHGDVVKEFVWRHRGGNDTNFDDRDFQLVTWSKDRTLRIWPVSRETTERVGFKYGDPIRVLHSRAGAPDITYTLDREHMTDPQGQSDTANRPLAAPILVHAPSLANAIPSGIARQRIKHEAGMTRGGRQAKGGMDQLDWLSKVVKNTASPDSSTQPSRMGSVGRTGTGTESVSRAPSTEGRTAAGEWLSLKDEVVMVNKLFPRPRINFEKIDLHHRKLTISMNGPWANGDRMAFMRIHWSFPASYPYSQDLPTFELERNPTVSPIVRQKVIQTIKLMRAATRQCLVSTSAYLLGVHERGRRLVDDSDSEDEVDRQMMNVPMLVRTCGATFGPNGQLVCFFPKQTILPRARTISRSPSESRRTQTPLAKAMFALSRMENPRSRGMRLKQPRLKRFENLPISVQAGSTVTVHDVAQFGHPDPVLARLYSFSIERNHTLALEQKRLDHAVVWATLRGLLSDPPPPYSEHPPLHSDIDARKEREMWERGVVRKRLIINEIYAILAAARDMQVLAIMSAILLQYSRETAVPPLPQSFTNFSPQQDYFTLPRVLTSSSSFKDPTPNSKSPLRKRPSLTPNDSGSASYSYALSMSTGPGSSGPATASFRGSGWSQYLNPSSISLRNSSGTGTSNNDSGITRYDNSGAGALSARPSVDGQSVSGRLPPSLSTSYEDKTSGGLMAMGLSIPVPFKRDNNRGGIKDKARVHRLSFPTPPTASSSSSGPASARSSLGGAGRGVSDQNSPTVRERANDTERQRSSPLTQRSYGSSSDLQSGQGGSVPNSQSGSGSGYTLGSNSASASGSGSGSGFGNGSSFNIDHHRHKVSFGAGNSSPLRRNFSRATVGSTPGSTSADKHNGSEAGRNGGGRKVTVCGVRLEVMRDETPSPSLLTPEMLVECEGFKLTYADYLLRQGLHGQRAALMQFDFVHGITPPAQYSRKRGGAYDGAGLVCITCAAGADTCPSCEQVPIPPVCALCRLPIKGLSMACGICDHRTHSACFRKHFAVPVDPDLTESNAGDTCPACPCRCPAQHGTSYPSIAVPIAHPLFSPSISGTQSTATLTATLPRLSTGVAGADSVDRAPGTDGRPATHRSLSPINTFSSNSSPGSAGQAISTAVASGPDSTRAQYTSIARTLSAIQENDLRLQLEAQMHAQGQGHNPLYAPMYPRRGASGTGSGMGMGLGLGGMSPVGEDDQGESDVIAPAVTRASGLGLGTGMSRGLSSWSQVVQNGLQGSSGAAAGSGPNPAPDSNAAAVNQHHEVAAMGTAVDKNAREGLLSRGRLRGLTGDGILNWKAYGS